MFKRKISSELTQWFQEGHRDVAVVRGLRQIGKTTVVKDFAKSHFPNVVYLNFKDDRRLKECFRDSLKVDSVLLEISAKMPTAMFIPLQTVIVFDEVQECSQARAFFKELKEDVRFAGIATGSMLGLKGYNRSASEGIPVGSERVFEMRPMDFEEYLWARGFQEETIDKFKAYFDRKEALPPSILASLSKLYREYLIVGGMPEVVSSFLEMNSFGAAYQKQKALLENYRNDFAKYLDKNEEEQTDRTLVLKISQVFSSLASQLAKENNSFSYNKMGKFSSNKTHGEAIQWLIDYGLVLKCENLSRPSSPLSGFALPQQFKLYLADPGLLFALLEESDAQKVLDGDMNIYRGVIYENAAAATLTAMNRPLYYFSRSSGLEIDFIIAYRGGISLLEVKAKSGKTKAAKTVLEDKTRYPDVQGLVRVGEYNINQNGVTLTLPSSLLFLLKEGFGVGENDIKPLDVSSLKIELP